MTIDSSLLRRLALAKYFHEQGLSYFALPEPISSTGLLLLHDAVEMVLIVVAEHCEVQGEVRQLPLYWDKLLETPSNTRLGFREPIRRFSRCRAQLKHYALFPSKIDMEYFRSIVSEFLSETVSQVFSLEFDQISLLELIADQEVREALQAAKIEYDEHHYCYSLALMQNAFYSLFRSNSHPFHHRFRPHFSSMDKLDEYSHINISRPSFSRVGSTVGGNVSPQSADETCRRQLSKHAKAVNELRSVIKDVFDRIEEIERRLVVAECGISNTDYSKFMHCTVHAVIDKERAAALDAQLDHIPSQEEFDWCMNFLVQTAINFECKV